MIAEAIDAAVTVGWALLAWIVLTAVFATAALYAVVAAGWLVCRGAWRAARALRHRTPSGNLPIPAPIASRRRPQPSRALPPDPGPENASPSPNPEKEPIA